MITLIHGKDTFDSYNFAKKKIKEISLEKNFPIKIIELDEVTDFGRFFDNFSDIGLFNESFVFLGKRISDNSKLMGEVVKNFDILTNSELLLWEDVKMDSKLKLFKLISQKGAVKEFPELKIYEIEKWLKNILKVKNINIPQEAIQQLLLRYGTNKWLIFNQLVKLMKLPAEDNLMDNNNLDILLGANPNGDIWKLLEFFSNRQKDKLFKEYEKFSMLNPNSQLLVSMLHRELMLMAKIKHAH